MAALAALAGAVALAAPGAAAAAFPKGLIVTVAGTGNYGYNGDAQPAVSAKIYNPGGLSPTADGGFLFADTSNNRVRKVDASGMISTVAGTGTPGYTGDGGQATTAEVNFPNGVAALPDGGYLIADSGNACIRRVAANGKIKTVAGMCTESGFSGDGAPAAAAKLDGPDAVSPLPDGGFLIADRANARIRRVSSGGTITTMAGKGVAGFAGDGGPATQAKLNQPRDVSATSDGGFLIADGYNDRVRKVSAGGSITTVAGGGSVLGDGGPATHASLRNIFGVAALHDGSFLVSDTDHNRVRKVSPSGTIKTVAGTGALASSGDGGPATAAEIDSPHAVAPVPGGGFLIGDFNVERIRYVSG